MTREEASQVIKAGLEDMSLDYFDEEQYEALTMAIKALEQNESAEEWYKLFVEKLEQAPKSPCDLCRFNPPSSADGKPCTMCPAEGSEE